MATRHGSLRNVKVTPGRLSRGFKVWRSFHVAIVGGEGNVVAGVDKTLCIRRDAARA